MKISASREDIEIQWSPPENYHLTLVFFGDHGDAQINELQKQISKVASQVVPFSLNLTGVGAFPEVLHPRALWLGCQNGTKLKNLYWKLLDAMEKTETEVFSPHVTFGRLRKSKSVKNLLSPFIRKDFGEFRVERLVLYESRLQGHYQVYKPVFEVPLTGSPEL